MEGVFILKIALLRKCKLKKIYMPLVGKQMIVMFVMLQLDIFQKTECLFPDFSGLKVFTPL